MKVEDHVKSIAKKLGYELTEDELKEVSTTFRIEYKRVITATSRIDEKWKNYALGIAEYFTKRYIIEIKSKS